MGEANSSGGKPPSAMAVARSLEAEGCVPAGWVGVALLIPGIAPALVAFRDAEVGRLISRVERALAITAGTRNCPSFHASLWRAMTDIARLAGSTGDVDARARLGRHALWLALNAPDLEVRRRFDALRRNGIAPHITLTAAGDGLWRCAVGPRFEDAAVDAARAPAGPTVDYQGH